MHNDQGNSFPPFELLLPTIHDGHSSDLSSFSKATPPMRPHDMPDDSFASPFRAFPKPKQKKFDTSLLSPPLKDAFLWSDNALLGRETPRLGSPVGQTPGIPLDPIDLLEGPADGSRFLHPPLSTEGDILFG
ncbi:hypothetical protein CPB86DRAFT_477603 [Serendipita vermifera]|nr:hypothetical protein CPB86DRAFT_477603 [Serendipita vermifera]